MRVFRKVLCAGVVGLMLAACTREPADTPSTAAADIASGNCWVQSPVETGGQRRLALIVGVGDYKSSKVNDLAGPPNDARRIAALLTNSSYGFPKENVCLLVDADATRAGFESNFDQLIERTRAEDLAVVFFAGHGSQTKDVNGDEPDEWDETLLMHDSRTEGVHDLRDDELNGMLARLNARTQHAVLILDSCNSGTATRGPSALVARFFEPEPPQQAAEGSTEGDGDGGYAGAALPGLVALTAASDGTPALERDARGIFTDALIQVLSRASAEPITYAQLARQVAPLVAAESYQIPYFQGNLQRSAFALTTVPRPMGWEVVSATGSTLKLSGPSLPGMGVGAELRIYDGAASATDTADPAKALATIEVTELTGVNATARMIATDSAGPSTVQAGDLAVLVRPADDLIKLKVRLRPSSEGTGIPAARATRLRERIRQHAETGSLIDLVEQGDAFELSVASDGSLVLWGPENRIRNMIRSDDKVPEVLRLHAQQRALLQLRGEGGAHFVDNETLQVRLVPAARQGGCSQGEWVQAALHQEQVIPLCHRWHVQVHLSERSPMPLLIGALIMSTDGSIFALPQDGRTVLLRPDETVTFDSRDETFRGSLPLDTQDQVLVFGTQERNPVGWHQLTQTADKRGPPAGSGLHAALDRYLRPEGRGTSQVSDSEDETTWTMSALTMRVEANPRFLQAQSTEAPNKREYTLKTFDIRPYLPDDRSTALYKLLERANWLATAARDDSFGYKQHDWSLSDDAANLQRGIDCSRAVWFAFTRAGLPYNNGDRYLTTADMARPNSPLAEHFDRCSENADLQLGDLLVYRSDTKGDGHVVMVVDPRKRIAWGSHGWDGEAKDSGYVIKPDLGVEYQLIKYKQDWQRWDRRDMQLKACWRYRKFREQAEHGTGVPGVQALGQVCDERQCRL